MKARFTLFVLVLVLAAGGAGAADVKSVLASDGTLYSVHGGRNAQESLALSISRGDVHTSVAVPGTGDGAVESDARLLWDSVSSTLFVVWHAAAAAQDSIFIATLDAEGVWSEPAVLASCSSTRRGGLEATLTRVQVPATETEPARSTTLIHAAWWAIGTDLTAEYALAAFEEGRLVSTDVARLDDLAARNIADGVADEHEDTGAAIHPPLAMARAGEGVDVVYGAQNTTKVTRVQIDPRRVVGDARMWKPTPRDVRRTNPARLIADSTAPLEAFISRGRIVLYQPDRKFRFVVLEDGNWSPERMIALDEHLTSDQLLDALRRTVDEQSAADAVAKEQK